MSLITLKKNGFRVTINPRLGGCLLEYSQIGEDGVPYDWLRKNLHARHPVESSCFVMAPYCSRVHEGIFHYADKKYTLTPQSRLPKLNNHLDTMHTEHALHGSAWINPWTVKNLTTDLCSLTYTEIEQDKTSVFSFSITQNIKLTESMLLIQLTLTNLGKVAMPFGQGLHPYFPIHSQTRIKAKVGAYWRTEKDMPVELCHSPVCKELASGFAPANNRLDNTFVDWDGSLEIMQSPSKRLFVQADALNHLCIYSPNTSFFCAEPVSNPANALNMMDMEESPHGMSIIEPNMQMSAQVRFIPFLSYNKRNMMTLNK